MIICQIFKYQAFSTSNIFRNIKLNRKLHLSFKIKNRLPATTWQNMTKSNLSPRDPSSYSRPEHAVVTDIRLDLTVDFVAKILKGNVKLNVEIIDKSVKELLLDVKDLNITEVVDAKSKANLKFSITDPVKNIGSKLTIETPNQENNYCVNISYSTSPDASGLQWLDPVHTAGKKHPYLFSQFQAIHARSAFPCQDTPAVKSKYTATITTDKIYTVLMSAERKGADIKGETKRSNFEQKVPVPSYLVALAVGVLDSRKIGPRSHVWAEKEIIEECAYEFADTEHQLKTAEDICGPYVWGIYDLLVLPPSFPYGGMENPCLTFVTPTLLAGDKSLANVVAHEIAHSWTGNLVTNRNFEHFWLNEGFTVFIERKILGRLSSLQAQDFDAYAAVSDLRETVARLGENNPLTSLVVNLTGVDPDDAFSLIPYEKGQTFLRYIENLVGGPEVFEPFLREYFDNFKYKSIDTDDFRTFLESHFKSNKSLTLIDWDRWLHTPGMPPVIPDYDTSFAKTTDEVKNHLLDDQEGRADFSVQQTKFNNMSPDQKIYLLQSILSSGPHSLEKLKFLQKFGFDDVKNAEIKFYWLRTCIKSHWEEKIQPVFDWINSIGRMKYVRPLYRDLYDWEYARPKAIENFEANRKSMMHVLEHGVLKDLHLET